MRGQSQEEFFKKIKSALADRGDAVDLPDDMEIARVISSDRDLVEVFMTRAEEAGSHAYRVADEQGVVDKVVELIEQAGAQSVIIPDEEIPARNKIIESLEQKGIRLQNTDDPDAAFDADFGITGATSAIAETASLCMRSGGNRRRLAGLAVPNHIAVVRADQIIPDLLEWADQQPDELPANMTLVSAPSKTADIEMILVMGVHGPKEEHIIILG